MKIMYVIMLSVIVILPVLGQDPGNGSISVGNEALIISFSRETGGILDITSPDKGESFISSPGTKPLMWELQFHGPDGGEVRINNAEAASPECTVSDQSLTLEWKNLGLSDEPGVLDVRVKCQTQRGQNTFRGQDIALLRIWVDNRSTQFSLWEVSFPVITGLGHPDRSDVAISRGVWGMLYQKPKERLSGNYPSHSLPMQFILIQEKTKNLYLAAHDPGAFYKTFEIEAGREFRVDTPAMDMSIPGNDWPAPFPFAIGISEGSWMEGCKRYRDWVTRNAPWTRKGPLSARDDVPDTITRVCAWFLANGGPEEMKPLVKRYAEAIGAPVGAQWYNWHQIPFDTYYPNYFPTKPGFGEAVRELTADGITIMPYINSRLWDSGNENFAEARPASVKNATGEVTIEEYGSGAKLAVMCPTQKIWQEKVAGIVQRLGDECGVNAVYLDQPASAPPRLCFDPTHGHTLGSGPWWVDGYRDLFTPIKNWCTSDGRAIALTSENNAEPYMDNIDAHLLWTQRSDAEVPMITAVYSGYSLYYGSNRAFGYGDTSYCMCQARDFVWGTQLGWDGSGVLAPEHEAELQFVSRLAKLRAKARDFLVYGELLQVMEPVNPVPSLSGTWNKPGGDGPVTLKAVQAALWKNTENEAGIFLANADTEPHTFTFAFDAAQLGLEKTTKWSMRQVSPDEDKQLPTQQGAQFTYSVDVSARDGLLLVFCPVSGG
ncbi:MAG: DUF6259 domain-containing protein [bacterium]